MNIVKEDCVGFPGDWSYTPGQMYQALKAVEYEETLKVLELGAGRGTDVLADLLQAKGVNYQYVSYENDPKWLPTRSDVRGILWRSYPDSLHPGRYDLVLLDGPRGSKTNVRLPWFRLLRPIVRRGTILVVDDFGHNPKYKEELDRHFHYFTVAEMNPEAEHGESWYIVRIERVR